MKKSACIVCVSLITVFCYASCATISPAPSWQPTAEALLKSPAPAVDFIDYLDPYPGQTGSSSKYLCMSLNPEAIYEPGDYKKDFDSKWQSLFQFTFDGTPISIDKISFGHLLMCSVNSEGRCALIHFMGCVPDLTLTRGLHTATLQATSMSGKVYSYSWAFRVDSTVENSDGKGFEDKFMDRMANGNLADPFAAKWATRMPYLMNTPTATEAH